MSRDLELLIKYHSQDVHGEYFQGFHILQSIIENDHSQIKAFHIIDLVNLDIIKGQVIEIIEYLIIKQRFRKLQILFNGKMGFTAGSSPCFEIDGHQFQTLDEVEKVWKNRMFL